MIGVGMARVRHPSPRTGLADLPHPALRSSVSLPRLAFHTRDRVSRLTRGLNSDIESILVPSLTPLPVPPTCNPTVKTVSPDLRYRVLPLV